MDEKKRSFIILGVIAVFLLLLVIIGAIQNKKEDEDQNSGGTTVTYNGQYSTEYNEAFNGEGKKVLYIGSSSCSICTEFTPYMKYLSEAYDFTYYYIDAALMDTTELIDVLEKVGQDIEEFGTPYVAFLENGEKYDDIPGYMTESGLFELLQENEIIDSGETYVSSTTASSQTGSSSDDDSDYTSLSFIEYAEYEDLYNGDEKFILVLGQSGCSACTAYKPIINEIAKEHNINVYYVDMNALVDSEPYKLMATLSYFDDIDSWGTPLTLIVENQEVVAAQEGYNETETTEEFLKENGFIK